MRRLPLLLLIAACTSTPDDDTAPLVCEAADTYDVAISGKVEDASGSAVADAAVTLTDFGWAPGSVLGEATSNAQGRFSLVAVGVTDVPGCWGTVLDYEITATEGARYGQKVVNSHLHGAITDGTLATDLTAFPVTIE